MMSTMRLRWRAPGHCEIEQRETASMLHARKQDLLGMGCTTLYHSYLQEQSSIGMDKQWVEGRDATGGKLACKSRAGNLDALPTIRG
jgi:hypothetical protein